jgi:hypothetical protein
MRTALQNNTNDDFWTNNSCGPGRVKREYLSKTSMYRIFPASPKQKYVRYTVHTVENYVTT